MQDAAPTERSAGTEKNWRNLPKQAKRPMTLENNNIKWGWSEGVVLMAALISLALGVVTLAAWHLRQDSLLLLHANWPPMQPGAAACFLLSGLGLGLLVLRYPYGAAACGAGVLVLGGWSLLEYGLGMDSGLDTLWLKPYAMGAYRLGRMAPPTAMCFLLAGTLFACHVRREQSALLTNVTGVTGAILCATASGVLFSYWVESASIGWWESRMAPQTAFCFLILGAGFITLSWSQGTPWSRGGALWLPLAVGLGLLSLTLILWQALVASNDKHIRNDVASRLKTVSHHLAGELSVRIYETPRAILRDQEENHPSEEVWNMEIRAFQRRFPNCSWLCWMTPDRNFRGPQAERARAAWDRLPSDAQAHLIALSGAAEESRAPVLASSFQANSLWVLVPVHRRQEFKGWMVSSFELQEFLGDILSRESEPACSLQITDQDGETFQWEYQRNGQEWSQTSQFKQYRLHWSLKAWPPASFLYRQLFLVSNIVLMGGLLLAGLLCFTIWLLQRVRHRSEEIHQMNLRLGHEMRERQQFEDSLRVSETHFRSVSQSAREAIISTQAQGRIIFWNRGAQSIFGYSEDEMTGQPVDKLFPGHIPPPAHTGDSPSPMALGLVEAVGIRKDGTQFPIELSLNAWESGPERFYTAIIRDISRRRAQQEALETARRDLEQRVAERTAQLASVNAALRAEIAERQRAEEALKREQDHLEEQVEARTQALKESNQELESFTYTVSHDLRSPLWAMQGFASALIEDHASALDETARDYCRRIIVASQRMDKLIHDLLAYSRLRQSQLALVPLHLETVLDQTLASLEEEVAKRQALVRVDRPLPTVLGHAATLGQVLFNLLSNALKFVPHERTPVVTIRAESKGALVRLWIEDNGIGIKHGEQERLFQMFQRLGSVESYPGTGIGLAIVRKAIERMGGQVGVESQPHLGSRFWLELPSAPLPAPASAPPRPDAPA